MKLILALLLLLGACETSWCWGFFGHRRINYLSVFLLPPEMLVFFKPSISYLEEHAVDPDKRRYATAFEAPRHYIDLDHYGHPPYDSLPRRWMQAVEKYSADTLHTYGIVPWWVQTMLRRLTASFREKDGRAILKTAADIGHYISDAHVPLHATRNHNGQYTGQQGIHGFWESRIPEMMSDLEWDFFIGKAIYIDNPSAFIWQRVVESAAAADTVLRVERQLSARFPPDRKYAFEIRNGVVVRQYSSAYAREYNALLQGMIERRMQQSVLAVASFWYTAWVDAGRPDLKALKKEFSPDERIEMEKLDRAWRSGFALGRKHELPAP